MERPTLTWKRNGEELSLNSMNSESDVSHLHLCVLHIDMWVYTYFCTLPSLDLRNISFFFVGEGGGRG